MSIFLGGEREGEGGVEIRNGSRYGGVVDVLVRFFVFFVLIVSFITRMAQNKNEGCNDATHK
jgi:hypothetical protein